MSSNKAIFLDRDGTLVEEVNYLHRVEDLRLYDFTAAALNGLKAAGYLLIVVTNQSGIGRGVYSEANMHSIHEAMQARLAGVIDAFYFCPHLPGAGCTCRKPGPGMIEAACSDFEIDLPNSWMVGDKALDVETGMRANMRSALVLTGYGEKHQASLEGVPDVVAADFGVAASRILAADQLD